MLCLDRGSVACFLGLVLAALLPAALEAQDDSGLEPIGSGDCVDCHETSRHDTLIRDDLDHSIHEFLECLDCHEDKDTLPHREATGFRTGHDACAACHPDAGEAYVAHGREATDHRAEIPECSGCHGDHDILPSSVKLSRTHRTNLPVTCGACHEDLNLTKRHEALKDHPIQVFETSIHWQSADDNAASCIDCHSPGGTAHKILGPGDPASSVNHFRIPSTCGACHGEIESEFRDGIHGHLVERGETDAPVCTTCHSEHGILAHDDPRSTVSKARLAEATCSPCHDSVALNERYALPAGTTVTHIDSYHGLKTKAGDLRVANCASCHGVHKILPSTHPDSSIHPANLQQTCSACHPKITPQIASVPIHGVDGNGGRAAVADLVERIYIVLIVVVIGAMALHWLLDLIRQIHRVTTRQPQVRRMRPGEVWQHTLLMVSFLVLVVSGFALRFGTGWLSRFFFGWEGGFEARGLVHRIAAVVFMATTAWHLFFLALTRRGRQFWLDMWPRRRDLTDLRDRLLYNLGLRRRGPTFARFGYVEKAEYWALVWGTALMVLTGVLLWYENLFVRWMPRAVLDVALVVHYWEAWLATLAIAVWHLYSTVFSPHVYPMNPSWLTGTMPEEMYREEHAEHLEEAKRETSGATSPESRSRETSPS